MARSAENTLAELDAFIEAGESRRIEQAGLVALLTAQNRDVHTAQLTFTKSRIPWLRCARAGRLSG
ncbi:hypothetical protein [Methylobacterium goesingense]|uniref:Uncharacterized protein n=1 Tax=Methylobacterium goesingense TaxID=243690 RepID=A0ABV2LFV9_9HYPH|nr:hypothetical protein [Methylobacterium goesingense]GJD76581.1 hypothetical protein CFIICLFH_4839 [Methylobacterium goesingense]